MPAVADPKPTAAERALVREIVASALRNSRMLGVSPTQHAWMAFHGVAGAAGFSLAELYRLAGWSIDDVAQARLVFETSQPDPRCAAANAHVLADVLANANTCGEMLTALLDTLAEEFSPQLVTQLLFLADARRSAARAPAATEPKGPESP